MLPVLPRELCSAVPVILLHFIMLSSSPPLPSLSRPSDTSVLMRGEGRKEGKKKRAPSGSYLCRWMRGESWKSSTDEPHAIEARRA